MNKTHTQLIEEGIAHTTGRGDAHIEPYRVLSWLYSAYPEDARLFNHLPSAQDIRDYVVERDPGREFEKLGTGDCSFYIERKPLPVNEVQPRTLSRKAGSSEVMRVPVRISGGLFELVSSGRPRY